MQLLYITRRVASPNFKWLFGVVAVCLFAACGKTESASGNRQNANANQANSEAPIAITVDKAIAREVPAVIQATGSLVAEETSDIASKVAGKVTNIYANVGQYVGQGAVIAKLDENGVPVASPVEAAD